MPAKKRSVPELRSGLHGVALLEAVGEDQSEPGEHAAAVGAGVEGAGHDRIDRQGPDRGVGQAVVYGAPVGATVRALEHTAIILRTTEPA